MGLDHTSFLGYISSHVKNALTPKEQKVNLPSNALVSFLKTCCLVLCNVLKSCKTCKRKKIRIQISKEKKFTFYIITRIQQYFFPVCYLDYFSFLKMFLFIFETEGESRSRERAEREGDRL